MTVLLKCKQSISFINWSNFCCDSVEGSSVYLFVENCSVFFLGGVIVPFLRPFVFKFGAIVDDAEVDEEGRRNRNVYPRLLLSSSTLAPSSSPAIARLGGSRSRPGLPSSTSASSSTLAPSSTPVAEVGKI